MCDVFFRISLLIFNSLSIVKKNIEAAKNKISFKDTVLLCLKLRLLFTIIQLLKFLF